MENTIELEIPLLLPGVKSEHDQRLRRLEETLSQRKGVARAHIHNERQPLQLCLHYNPSLVSLNDIQRIAQRAGAEVANRYHGEQIPIEGMDCSDCVLVIEHSLNRLEGVLAVTANYLAESLWVEYDGFKTNRGAIEKRVRSLGYTVPTSGLQRRLQDQRELLFSLLSGLLLLLGWLGETFLSFPPPLTLVFYLPAYILGGWDVARHAWHALRERRFDTDVLMILAALGAASIGYFAEGALLLFLFSLGHALEERALDRARASIRALQTLAPVSALVLSHGQARETPIEKVALEDVVLIPPGVRIPVDGVIVSGSSAINEAPVTGESLPVEKTVTERVFAGTVNGQGALQVRVTRLAQDSTLARIIKMVAEAQGQKSPTQRTVEKFERFYVPSVLAFTAGVIILPPLFFGWPLQESFLRGMTLLVATSPCALALGTPAAVMAGVAQAARFGVLVKGGVHLENLGQIKAVAFDKTGTLTHGKPVVTDIIPNLAATLFHSPGGNIPPVDLRTQLLALFAAVESQSAHPLAQAVTQAAREMVLVFPTAVQVESLSGLGVRARVDGQAVMVGSLPWLENSGARPTQDMRTAIADLEASGKTVILAAVEAPSGNPNSLDIAGLIALADTPRPGVAAAVQALRSLGILHTVLLTGDNPRTAQAVASQVGVQDYQASLLPQEKLTAISQLEQRFGPIAMVGDGVNDAPALARATVGIAMGGASTDVALEVADVALMSADLSRLPFAIGLGRATRTVIKQNLAIALGVILLLGLAALTGWAGIGLAVLFHEGSTLVVVANALRLLRYQPATLPNMG